MDDIVEIVASVLPDRRTRLIGLTIFAESIFRAHSHGARKWGAYTQSHSREGIRLLCGDFIILTLHRDYVWLSLDKEGFDTSDLAEDPCWHRDEGNLPGGYPSYSRTPSVNIYYKPDDLQNALWPHIQTLHFQFIDRVGEKYESLRVSSQKKHQHEFIDYLASTLGYPIPKPNYTGHTIIDDSESMLRRRVHDDLNTCGEFDPSSLEEAKERVIASIVRRQGQQTFRNALLELYGSACVFTGCSIVEILDAAHIIPYSEKGTSTNDPRNGLLLRTDIHTLFDLHLIAVDTVDFTILVAPHLRLSEYGPLHGKRIKILANRCDYPSRAALDEHRIMFERKLKK